jgi:Major tropism determinant N-terminal domain
MAGTGQFRRGTTAQWSSANPILADGELGIERTIDGSTFTKIGDGNTHWNSLGYGNLGFPGPTGPTGPAGTGLSRTINSSINFGNENTYLTQVILDASIKSTSTVIIQPLGEEYAIQRVVCGVLSIIDSSKYTIFAAAPDGASGNMSMKILIF